MEQSVTPKLEISDSIQPDFGDTLNLGNGDTLPNNFVNVAVGDQIPGISNSGNKVLLAGIIQGNFSKGSMVTMNQTGDISFTVDNIGISAVVPANKLYEVLYSKDLIDQRKSIVENVPASR